MQIISHKLFILYLLLFLLLNSSFALQEDQEIKIESETNPIPELYQNVSIEYMTEVLGNLSKIFENYVFLDIMKNPPKPYDVFKVNVTNFQEVFADIDISQERPFYEFYRDVKVALSVFHDANLDIMGGEIPFETGNINFENYRMCLPFKFYLDYDKNNEVKLFIKEYELCSKLYNDSSLIEKITALANEPLLEINGQDALDFLQEFGTDIYKFKNPDSYFNILLDSIFDNYLVLTPISIEKLNCINLTFNNSETINTKFHIIKTAEETKEKNKEINTNIDVDWDLKSQEGEIKCRVDKTNELNVLFFNSFYIEDEGSATIYKCAKLFYSNDYKIVIITSQLWTGDNLNSYIYTQMLFPKIDIKFNMAMRQTKINEQIFNQPDFLDSKTCQPYNSWEDFIEPQPDDYGEGVLHNRTKIFNPIPKGKIEELNEVRKEFMKFGHLKKSTDIIILTDSVNYGSGSFFMKTIQNNGGAIIASYAGNPNLNKSNITTLDASTDPVLNSNYENTVEYRNLYDMGFVVFNIPLSESFENVENNDYPMAFKVKEVDEMTNIYHFYDDAYYEEFITEAKKILDEYNENPGRCSKINQNLVLEKDECIFTEDEFAHGGYKCDNTGLWSTECQKSYCDFGFFYNKATGQCELDKCLFDEIIEINEETEKTIGIEPEKSYFIKLNTSLYTYFFSSPVDNIMMQSNFKECPRFCALKTNVDYMYINYYRKLDSSVNITITSKKIDLNIESEKINSPKFSGIREMIGNMYFIFQITEDNYMYIDSFDKRSRFYYAIYDENMTPDDIINMNEKYFREGLEQLLYLAKD